MASYLIFTPPGAGRNDGGARFVVDGFSKTAFFFPAIWLLAKSQWLAGFLALGGQIAALSLLSAGLSVSGAALQLAISLAAALEGGNILAWSLKRSGWTFQGVIPADSLETAEDLYFDRNTESSAVSTIAMDRSSGAPKGSGMALGLFDMDGSR